jgi:hypothetical protein
MGDADAGGIVEMGDADARGTVDAGDPVPARTGGGGGRDERLEEGTDGVASEPIRGKFAGRGNGVLSALESEARGNGVAGRESRLAPLGSTLGRGERVAGTSGVRSCFSKANSKVAMGRS